MLKFLHLFDRSYKWFNSGVKELVYCCALSVLSIDNILNCKDHGIRNLLSIIKLKL